MEIEKTLTVNAPREKVWALLLDPTVMTGAVPGMQSIDVISPVEYAALMKVKISFISAKFKLNTRIVEQRAPEYLKAEGTGEDASVASSLRQTSEVFLTDAPDGGTALRIKVNVDVLGRLGSFGLSVMKTKADRMWDEFGKNLAARLEAGDAPEADTAQGPMTDLGSNEPIATVETVAPGPAAESVAAPAAGAPFEDSSPDVASVRHVGAGKRVSGHGVQVDQSAKGWLGRLFSGGRSSAEPVIERSGRFIRVDIRQTDKMVTVEWPVEAAGQCQEWLNDVLKVR